MVEFDDVKRLIGEILQLGERVRTFGPDTPLLGSIPEFDSMAVVNLITTLEERFGFTVDDDEIEGSTFATVGSLTEFVEGKLVA